MTPGLRAEVVARLRSLAQCTIGDRNRETCREAADELETKSSESSMVQRIEALENFTRKVAGMRLDVGHDGDEESGQHDPDCEGCMVECLRAEADHLLYGPPDPERDRESRADLERP